MTIKNLPATCAPLGQLLPLLRDQGYAVLSAPSVAAATGLSHALVSDLEPSWNDLPADHYLKDGGRYRSRRHACFTVSGTAVIQMPHRAHWQPLDYNALHGGMQRWFEPLHPSTSANPALGSILIWLADVCSQLKGEQPWFAEVHQFRIDTTDGIGRPTPEGAHRDGVDMVAVFMVARHGVKGGETRVFDAAGPNGQRFTLSEPWSVLLLDDARVIHESTPIQPEAQSGHRDTLVITLRAGAFQGEGQV
jgi:hypothetical protein